MICGSKGETQALPRVGKVVVNYTGLGLKSIKRQLKISTRDVNLHSFPL